MQRFASFEEVTAAVVACLGNAARLLNAARETNKPGQHHIAYHLAALSLEEIGKASMLSIEGLVLAVPNDDEDERRPVEWIEDHERKLFWALWTPSFRSQPVSVQQMQEFQRLAKNIHEHRMATLYVNPSDISTSDQVTDEDVQALLQITEARLEMEPVRDFGALDDNRRELIAWFFRATNHPELKRFVFSGDSLKKMAELKGDSLKWVTWMRDTVKEADRVSKELIERELQRADPVGKEMHQPKWQIKIRLQTSTHTIRPKALAQWNKHTDWIKFVAPKKTELLIDLTLLKSISVQSLWPSAMELATMVVISFNVGTLGLFWWYLPTFVSKFYETIIDLESKSRVQLERNPPLVAAQTPRVLLDADLKNVRTMLIHLMHIRDKRTEPYKRYFKAIGLLAKNDLFGEFQHTLLIEFSGVFRSALEAYGDWDGAQESLDRAIEGAFDLDPAEQFVVALKETLRMATVVAKDPSQTKLSLDDALKMKAFCDAYLLIRAKAEVQTRARATSQPPSDTDNPSN